MNTMKKSLALVMALVMIVAMMAPVASAEEAHEHVWADLYVAETAATCSMPGLAEHYYCEECNTYFVLENGNYMNTTPKSLVTVPAYGHTDWSLSYYGESEATCSTPAMKAHYYCADCDTYFVEENGNLMNVARLSLVIAEADGKSHVMTHNEATEATCIEPGLAEHDYCSVCDNYFITVDGNLMNVARLSLVVAEADGKSHNLVHFDATEATCVNNGMAAHEYCSLCDTFFVEEEGNLKNVAYLSLVTAEADGKSHVLTSYEASEATCVNPAMAAHTYCSECDCYFVEVEGNLQNIAYLSLVTGEPNAEAHNLEFFPEAPATCTSNGVAAHYYCDLCNCFFVEENGNLMNIAYLSLVTDLADGKSHVMEYNAASEATCVADGMAAHFYCAECDCYFTLVEGNYVNTNRKNLITEVADGTKHNLSFYGESEATCATPAMKAHYYCADCDCYFVEVEGNLMNVARLSLVIAEADGKSHNLVENEASEATCTTDGMAAHFYCEICDCYFVEVEGNLMNVARLSLVTEPANGKDHGNLIHNEATTATCVNPGLAEHYYCYECDCYFTMVEGNLVNTNRLNLVIAPADGKSHVMTHFEATEATCVDNGVAEHDYCSECDCYFITVDGNLMNVAYLSLVTAEADGKSHNLTHVEEVAATCVADGVAEHYYCDLCDCYFTMVNGNLVNTNIKNLVLLADGKSHNLKHFEEVPATCVTDGVAEHDYCDLCDCYFTLVDGNLMNTNIKNLVLVADGKSHVLTHYEYVAPTATKDGVAEHFYCEACDCYFIEVEGNLVNTNAKNVIIPALGESDIPQTGLVWWPVAALSLAGAGMIAAGAVKSKKERDEE